VSHYTVLVAIDPTDPKRSNLETALAPFDENTEVEPYRKYETGAPVDYWSWEKTPDAPTEPTWAQVAEVHNAKYDDDRLHVDEDGRAYTLSTYNPDSRWDWWTIGGRWTGWFRVCPEYIGHGDVINGEPGLLTEANTDEDWCDGGPKRVLDFKRTRDWRQVDEALLYSKFHKLIDGTPEAALWSSFIARHDADKDDYSIEQARREYHAQPRVQALKGTDFDWDTSESLERFQRPREEVLARAAARAVPGYATLTLDGQWKEPGQMGWFDMSTDTPESQDAYYAWANEYVDSLDEEIVLVLVDVHI
jgi:hypothetical protein